VAGPYPMAWPEYALARQYLVEEFIGSKVREAKEIERAQARQSRRSGKR
jgi:hypothetical protein